MDWVRTRTNWLVYAVQAQVRWSLLKENDLKEIDGHRDRLIIYVQDLYGLRRERAETDVDNWCNGLADTATLVTSSLNQAK